MDNWSNWSRVYSIEKKKKEKKIIISAFAESKYVTAIFRTVLITTYKKATPIYKILFNVILFLGTSNNLYKKNIFEFFFFKDKYRL